MQYSYPLLSLCALVSAGIIVERDATQDPFKWTPCQPGSTTRLCGTLDVPLDYTNKTTQDKLTLQLMKVPAVKQPSNGSVLLNFGGPGGPGRMNLEDFADRLQSDIIGPQYDLVAFDPRGTNTTLFFNCSSNATEASLSQLSTPPVTTNSSDVSSGQVWAIAENLSNQCAKVMKANGSYVGTAAVARDLMQVVDALGGDKMLRYWGISYGSMLGQTVAAMFPDRIERMVIDGILNPHEYFKGYDYGQFDSSDEAFLGIIAECARAGPSKCALAKDNTTAEQLQETVLAALEDLRSNPIPIGTGLLEYGATKLTLFNSLYYSTGYPQMMEQLNGLVTKNLTQLLASDTSSPSSSSASLGNALQGIKCADKVPRSKLLKDFQPVFDEFEKTAPIFGETAGALQASCATWPFEAPERYLGDFNVQTKYPILMVGNTYDPATSFKSAQNASATFAGSVLLQSDSFGHTSALGQHSNCSDNAIRAYFESGKLPVPGTKCQPDAPLF